MAYREEDDDDFYNQRDDSDSLPDTVKNFAVKFNKYLSQRNVLGVQDMYENDYVDITDRYYKVSSWPKSSAVAPAVDDDENFLVLYRELFFRHIYSKLSVNLHDRLESFGNYIELFNIILGLNTEQPEIELPSVWLWDMIDEFVYQFQSFHTYRHRVKELSEEDVEDLKVHQHVWSAQTVTRYLHALVKKANIDCRPRSADEQDTKDASEDVDFMFKSLGHFALVGLARVNVLIGDYASALECLNPMDLYDKNSPTAQVTACHCTMYDNMGFAYFMTRRYTDCVKTLQSFINFVGKHKSFLPRNYQADAVMKTVDRMYSLLAVAAALNPQRIDDNIATDLKERFGDQLTAVQNGDADAMEELFEKGCPKFITLAAPNYADTSTDQTASTLNLQVKLFRKELVQRQPIPQINSYLRMCTAVSLSKLSSFIEATDDATITKLLAVKHKGMNLRWKGGSPAAGSFQYQGVVDFYIQKDMIHLLEKESARRYGEFFLRNIAKLEDMIEDINAIGGLQTSH